MKFSALYDALDYAEQVEKAVKSHREARKKRRYVSGSSANKDRIGTDWRGKRKARAGQKNSQKSLQDHCPGRKLSCGNNKRMDKWVLLTPDNRKAALQMTEFLQGFAIYHAVSALEKISLVDFMEILCLNRHIETKSFPVTDGCRFAYVV